MTSRKAITDAKYLELDRDTIDGVVPNRLVLLKQIMRDCGAVVTTIPDD
jgi:hypothetical protein